MDNELIKQRISKSCSICEFAIHDEGLINVEPEQIVCTVDPNKPVLKETTDTCLKHKSKYSNLKIIVEKNHLEEYDPEKSAIDPRYKSANVPLTRVIGEQEWQ